MNRWLGLLARRRVSRPCRLEAQDTTATVSKADTALTPRPAPTVTLVLQEALDQARANSPAYRQTLNDAGPARWGVRNAYGSFAADAPASAGDLGYTARGSPTSAAALPSHLRVPHLGLQPRRSTGSSTGGCSRVPASRRRCRRPPTRTSAAPASTSAPRSRPSTSTRCRRPPRWTWPGSRCVRNADFLTLAQRALPGGPGHAARRASGRGDQGAVATSPCCAPSRRRTRPSWICCAGWAWSRRSPVDQIALTDSFPVTPPDFKLDELLALADEQNPSLRSLRARQDAATWSVRAAKLGVPADACLCRPDGAGSPRSSPTTTCWWDQTLSPRAGRRGELPVRQPGEDGAQPRRPGRGLLRRRSGSTPPAPRSHQNVEQLRPRREQRLPLRLHRPAVQASLTDLAAHLHRLRPLAPAVPGPGRRSRTPTRTCGPAGSRSGATCTPATWR